MKKLNEIRETLLSKKLLMLLCIQVIAIFLLLCVWLVIDWKVFWSWITKHTDSTLAITLIATVLGALIVRWGVRFFTYLRFYSRDYITFEADSTQVFHLSKKVEHLEYSVGEKMWEKLGTQNIVFGGSRGRLLLRGMSKIGTDGANISFATDAQVICSGNICTLVNYKQYNKADTSHAMFCHLFSGCTQLVVAPDLPSKALTRFFYYSMFANCSSLITAPELPATKLADKCYSKMFYGCTSLKVAPKLPATELANNCYSEMFRGCVSLKEAPELPATILTNGKGCYSCMFEGCISLKEAPKLPALDLSFECYCGMFKECSSLEKAPDLPAKCLYEKCYYRMFDGCEKLNEIAMFATNISAEECLHGWLNGTSQKGVFRKNKEASWNNKEIVPPNWTVVPTCPNIEHEVYR